MSPQPGPRLGLRANQGLTTGHRRSPRNQARATRIGPDRSSPQVSPNATDRGSATRLDSRTAGNHDYSSDIISRSKEDDGGEVTCHEGDMISVSSRPRQVPSRTPSPRPCVNDTLGQEQPSASQRSYFGIERAVDADRNSPSIQVRHLKTQGPSASRSTSLQVSPSESTSTTPSTSPAPAGDEHFLQQQRPQKRCVPVEADRAKRQRLEALPNLVDLTYDELGPQGAENGTATKPLPFRPEDLARFTSNSDIGQWLNDEIINTLFERIVGLRENLRTASSGLWLVEGKPLPCEPSTVFILPVNKDKHWILLSIDVEQRVSSLFDSLAGQDTDSWDKKCEQLSSRFISNRLPEPFNDGKGWRTTRPIGNPQQSNSADCGLYIIMVGVFLALGLKIPAALDNRFLRAFVHSLCTNINFVAAQDEDASNDKLDSQRHTSLPFVDALPPQCLPEYQNEVPGVPGVPGPITLEIIAQVRETANLYVDTQLSALSHLRTAVDPFRMVTEAIAETEQTMPKRLEELEREESALQNIRKTANDLRAVKKQNEFKSKANVFLAEIRREKQRVKYVMQLQRAAVVSNALDVARRLDTTYNQYLQHHTVHERCSII
ncbi:hypothetical protein F5883DRAFT_126438 [Diaporthe sp. PMI_573]|nr:hypothetical protein F5883DRAFT_126438 [Diaporthaceae sp. PMI_573]